MPAAEYVADLRGLAIVCEFVEFLNEALRDHLVCGRKNETNQRRFITEDGLTVSRALEIAPGVEDAEKRTVKSSRDHPSTFSAFGLHHYTDLPLGAASVPAASQHTMASIRQGCEGEASYIYVQVVC